MPPQPCHCTFSAQRSTNSSSLRLKLFFKYSRLTINRTGSRGRPAGLMPPPNSPSNAPRWLKVNDDSSGGMTLHDLASEYGVSAERIRQIEVAAMKKMRKALAESV